MIRCVVTLEVARPVSNVFAFVDDVGKAPQWLGRCVALQQTSSGPKRVGSTLRYQYKDTGRTGEMEGVVTEYEKDRRLGMKYSDKMMNVAVSFDFEAAGSGTRIHHAVEIVPKSFMVRLMSPVIRSATRKQVERDCAKLVELLQASG